MDIIAQEVGVGLRFEEVRKNLEIRPLGVDLFGPLVEVLGDAPEPDRTADGARTAHNLAARGTSMGSPVLRCLRSPTVKVSGS